MAQRGYYEQELDEDLGENLDFAIGNYVQNGAPGLYDGVHGPGICVYCH